MDIEKDRGKGIKAQKNAQENVLTAPFCSLAASAYGSIDNS